MQIKATCRNLNSECITVLSVDVKNSKHCAINGRDILLRYTLSYNVACSISRCVWHGTVSGYAMKRTIAFFRKSVYWLETLVSNKGLVCKGMPDIYVDKNYYNACNSCIVTTLIYIVCTMRNTSTFQNYKKHQTPLLSVWWLFLPYIYINNSAN